MEILLHNISHADLLVGFSLVDERKGEIILARPEFSQFHSTSAKINQVFERKGGGGNAIEVVAHEREMTHPHFAFKVRCPQTKYPVGFQLNSEPIFISNFKDFKFKGGEEALSKFVGALPVEEWHRKLAITVVYLPLLAVLIPKWRISLEDAKSTSCSKSLYLISGAGIPRNTEHSSVSNSTEMTGQLMAKFVQQYYPDIQLHQVHSGSNIFRYDDNVEFMNQKLRPLLEAEREKLVEKCNLNAGWTWQSHFHVTIAYADGPPARLSALNASLRLYKPSYLHIWQLKTFWLEFKLSIQDCDFHSFENIEASPSILSSSIKDDLVQRLVREMREFRNLILKTISCTDKTSEGQQSNELGSFWLRKSRKPVLSVLVVQKDGENAMPIVYRGMNMEVSMPTGSLCAERNVIGTALASDPTLLRRHLKMIGVLAVDLNHEKATSPITESSKTDSTANGNGFQAPNVSLSHVHSPQRRKKRPRTYSCDEQCLRTLQSDSRNPLAPCGACQEWLLKIAEVNPSLKIVTFDDISCDNLYMKQLL